MKKLLMTVIASVLLAACWGASSDEDDTPGDEQREDSIGGDEIDTLILLDEEVVPELVDDLFDEFFYSFTTDRRFQLQRVDFPLRCVGMDSTVQSLSREEWTERGLFESQEFFSVIYEREQDLSLQRDTALQRVSVEWFFLADDLVERYNFHRLGGKWRLTDFEREPTSLTPHASFVEFFARFATDSVYQNESIEFPLRMIVEGQDDEDSEEDGEAQLNPDDWTLLRQQLPIPQQLLTNIDYGQAALSENRKTLMVEGLSNGLFLKYKFDRTQGRWHLFEIEN